jgi:hypothetical protein
MCWPAQLVVDCEISAALYAFYAFSAACLVPEIHLTWAIFRSRLDVGLLTCGFRLNRVGKCALGVGS